jgi:hypothetical protein
MEPVPLNFIQTHKSYKFFHLKIKEESPVTYNIFSIFYTPVPLIHRYMQQLEDALNVSLCGHFLIVLATMCFAAFSVVTVR